MVSQQACMSVFRHEANVLLLCWTMLSVTGLQSALGVKHAMLFVQGHLDDTAQNILLASVLCAGSTSMIGPQSQRRYQTCDCFGKQ